MQQTPELDQNKVRQVNEQLPFKILSCSEGSAVTVMHITPFSCPCSSAVVVSEVVSLYTNGVLSLSSLARKTFAVAVTEQPYVK